MNGIGGPVKNPEPSLNSNAAGVPRPKAAVSGADNGAEAGPKPGGFAGYLDGLIQEGNERAGLAFGPEAPGNSFACVVLQNAFSAKAAAVKSGRLAAARLAGSPMASDRVSATPGPGGPRPAAARKPDPADDVSGRLVLQTLAPPPAAQIGGTYDPAQGSEIGAPAQPHSSLRPLEHVHALKSDYAPAPLEARPGPCSAQLPLTRLSSSGGLSGARDFLTGAQGPEKTSEVASVPLAEYKPGREQPAWTCRFELSPALPEASRNIPGEALRSIAEPDLKTLVPGQKFSVAGRQSHLLPAAASAGQRRSFPALEPAPAGQPHEHVPAERPAAAAWPEGQSDEVPGGAEGPAAVPNGVANALTHDCTPGEHKAGAAIRKDGPAAAADPSTAAEGAAKRGAFAPLPALPPAEQIGGILSGRLQDKADIKADIAPQRPAADVQPEHRPPAKTEILGIQLEPQSLGRVTIKMRLAGTALDLRIEAEQPETLRLLEREKGLLGSKLQAAGYSLDSLLIQLSEPQASHPSASLDLGAYEHDLQSSQHQGGEAGYGGPPAREHNPWLPPAAERNQESASDGSPSGIYI